MPSLQPETIVPPDLVMPTQKHSRFGTCGGGQGEGVSCIVDSFEPKELSTASCTFCTSVVFRFNIDFAHARSGFCFNLRSLTFAHAEQSCKKRENESMDRPPPLQRKEPTAVAAVARPKKRPGRKNKYRHQQSRAKINNIQPNQDPEMLTSESLTGSSTWIRRSSCRRVAFQTRMSATEQVIKRSEQSAGNMMSFTRAKWQVPRSSVSISIVTQYLLVRAVCAGVRASVLG